MVQESALYNARNTMILEIIAAAQNLHNLAKPDFRRDFPGCFTHEQNIWSVRNILAHQYGAAWTPAIDWRVVNQAITVWFPQLRIPLQNAIKALESEQYFMTVSGNCCELCSSWR